MAFGQKWILVVDESEISRRHLKGMLERMAFDVVEVGDTAAALAVLQHGNVHVVLATATGVGVDGLQILDWLRSGRSEVPVVLIGAKDDTALKLKALASSAAGWVSKPVQFDPLVDAIERTRKA